MKKIDYKKPNMCVVEIQQRQHLMEDTSYPAGPGGGGVHEFRGDSDEESSSNAGSVWDEEW